MKKLKIPLIVVGVLVLALLIAGIAYASPMLSMSPSETGMVPDSDVFSLKGQMNSLYFMEVEDGYIVVDGGSNVGDIEAAMRANDRNPKDVKYVLLTHSDTDHVAALSLFANAIIYMGEDETQMIDGTTKRNFFSSSSLPEEVQSRIVTVTDGQDLELGGYTVACIAAPGHTPGSMAFLVEGKWLFTGDAFLVKSGTAGLHPFTMDSATAAESIEKLLCVDSEIVYTAHYGYFTGGTLK